MSRSLRRYEILLPLRFNDGQPVPDDLVADTLLELEQRFGAVSSETQTIRGLWRHEGESYRDDLTRVFVDVADEAQHRRFFLAMLSLIPRRWDSERSTPPELAEQARASL